MAKIKQRSPAKNFIIGAVCACLRPWHSFRLKTRAMYSGGHTRLHLGAGGRNLDGWINIDYNYRTRPDVVLDLTRPLPLSDECVQFIYSEDFIEHLPYDKGRAFVAECHRVLAPGGTLRILTPDLALLARQYTDRDPGTLQWYGEHFGSQTAAHMLNSAIHGMEHQFLYDKEALGLILEETGFQAQRAEFNKSSAPQLCGLDQRKGALAMDAVKTNSE